MKKIFASSFIVFVLLLLVSSANAQTPLRFNINYNVAFPTGDFSAKYIGNTSFRGFTASLMYPVNEKISLGLATGFNDFYQKFPRQVLPDGKGTTVSAVVTNSLQVVPVLAKGEYNILTTGVVRPYVAVGAGVNFINYDHYLGEFSDPHNAVKFAVAADAGVAIPFVSGKDFAFVLGGGFNYSPFNYATLSNLNTWNVHAGLRIPLRD